MTNKLLFKGLMLTLSLSTAVPCHALSISGDSMAAMPTNGRSNSYNAPSGTNAVTSGGESDSYTVKESTTRTASEVGTPQAQPTEGGGNESNDSGGSGGGDAGTTGTNNVHGGARRGALAAPSANTETKTGDHGDHSSQASSALPSNTHLEEQGNGQTTQAAAHPSSMHAAVAGIPTVNPSHAVIPNIPASEYSSGDQRKIFHFAATPPHTYAAGSAAIGVVMMLLATILFAKKRASARLIRRFRKHARRILSALFCMALMIPSALRVPAVYATTLPSYMLYEGTLSDGSGNAITTARTFRFSFWKSADFVSGDLSGGSINTGASNYGGWQETKSYTPSTTGFFSIQLGESTPIDSLTANTRSYLQVEVKAFGAADTTYELIDVDTMSATVDRKYLSIVPYAKNAETIDGRQIGSGSGNIIMLGSGGSLSLNGTTTINANTKVLGNLSGSTLNVDGSASLNSTLTASGSIATKNNITINSGNANQDATLTFGNNLAAQTLKFNASLQRFEFSKGISVRGTMSGSSLRIDGNADIWGSLASSGSVTVRGTLSGAVIRSFGLSDCSNGATSKLLWDTTTGKFSCGNDQSGTWSGTGALQTSFDARYIRKAGGTMTGALVINLSSGTTGLSVKQTLSGSIIQADSQLRSSGSLVVNGATTLKSTTTINGATTINANAKVRGNLSGSTLTVDGNANLKGTMTLNGITYTPPSSDGSASGKVLATNSAGALSWIGAGRLQCSNTSIPSGNTIANTASETAFTSTCVIPANTLVAGDVLQMRLWGVYSNAVAPPTIQAKIKLNGTAIMDTGVFTGPGAATDKGWSADTVYTIFTSGASGTMDAQGYLEFSTAATAALAINVPNTSTKSIDTTVDNTVSVTVTWGTASTSNSVTLRNMSIMKWSR